MSATPPKADIERHDGHVRFVPKADEAHRTLWRSGRPLRLDQGLPGARRQPCRPAPRKPPTSGPRNKSPARADERSQALLPDVPAECQYEALRQLQEW